MTKKESSVKLINPTTHANTYVEVDHPFELAKDRHVLPVYAAEYPLAGSEMPIVFIKNKETGQMKSVVLSGLEPNENLFYDEGGWCAGYIPLCLRVIPFSVSLNKDNEDELFICIDEDSNLVNQDKQGEAMFDDKGEQTDFMKASAQLAADVLGHAKQTDIFINYLVENELLSQGSITVNSPDRPEYDLTGLYSINEEKLNELSDETFLEMRKKGYLAPVYAVLASSGNLYKLLRRREQLAAD